jgi:hypothetical protein
MITGALIDVHAHGAGLGLGVGRLARLTRFLAGVACVLDRHAGLRHIVTVWRTAFPDLHYQIQEEIVHDDKVVTRVLMRGTHLGEFQQGSDPAASWAPWHRRAGRSKQTRSTSGACKAARSSSMPPAATICCL